VWRESPEPREIVGVAADVRNAGLDLPVGPDVYVPFAQDPQLDMYVLLRSAMTPWIGGRRTAGNPRLDPDAPLDDVMSMDEVIAASPTLVWRRVPSQLIAILAVAAAAARIGRDRRSHVVDGGAEDPGDRNPHGARCADARCAGDDLGTDGQATVHRLVYRLPVSYALTRLLSGWLFGVTPLDAVTFTSVSLILVVVAFGASYAPARRAARVDPTTALRYE